MSLIDVLAQILPLLLNRTLDRIDKDTDGYKITAYTMGQVVRIDIKPK